jgi:hypothetical protein
MGFSFLTSVRSRIDSENCFGIVRNYIGAEENWKGVNRSSGTNHFVANEESKCKTPNGNSWQEKSETTSEKN